MVIVAFWWTIEKFFQLTTINYNSGNVVINLFWILWWWLILVKMLYRAILVENKRIRDKRVQLESEKNIKKEDLIGIDKIKQMNKNKFLLIVIGIIIFSLWFYWFHWRPSEIKKTCSKMAGPTYSIYWINRYERCLHGHGL